MEMHFNRENHPVCDIKGERRLERAFPAMRGHMPEALPDILDYLLSKGYKIVPISRIFLTEAETYIDHTGQQCRQTG